MPTDSRPPGSPAQPSGDLLSHASWILSREIKRLSPSQLGPPGRTDAAFAPALGGGAALLDHGGGSAAQAAGAALSQTNRDRLPGLAHELLAGLLAVLGQSLDKDTRPPISPPGRSDGNALRRQACDFVEALLDILNGGEGDKAISADSRVPLLSCEAPVQSGNQAGAILTVTNDEPTPADVSLYCTSFIADCGHQIPATAVAISPRRAVIAASGEAAFQIKISVSPQTPAATYSGLIQATGRKYVKVVLMVEVT